MNLQQLLASTAKIRELRSVVPTTYDRSYLPKLETLRVMGTARHDPGKTQSAMRGEHKITDPRTLQQLTTHGAVNQYDGSATNPYLMVIDFLDVIPAHTKHPGSTPITTKQGIQYLPLLSVKHPVMVRCSCQDYYYMWWWANDQHHVHQGLPMPVYHPVPGSTRPPKNPTHTPGLCKHLIGLIHKLEHDHRLKA